jgi:sarcosine oxidase
METLHARHVVLGAGAMGSATAYHLAKRGEPVVLVEQFAIGHDRGSSHGAARITRHSYADAHCARLMPEAFRCWRELEADAGQPLYVRTGGISFGPPESGYIAAVADNLRALEVPHRQMSAPELARALPVFQVPGTYDAVFEPDAGMLAAAKAVALQVVLARELGGAKTRVLENCPIERIDLSGEKPTLVAQEITIVADCLVVTAGAWLPQLLPELAGRLRPTRQQVLYFRPDDLGPFQVGQFPVFIYKGVTELDDYYGMPPFGGCDVKVARHGGPGIDPGRPDREVGDAYREIVRTFLRKHIPALADAPISRAEVCLYTMSPDEQFQLGCWQGRGDVIVASPCSGHGFKFSNLIGKILADLAVEGTTELPIEPWRLR